MPKIARIEDHDATERGADRLTKIARLATEQGGAAREEIERVTASVTDAAPNQQQIGQSAGASAELGRTVVELIGEQTRHNMQVAAAVGRVMNWADVVEIQRDYLTASFERMNRLGEQYRAMMQAGTKSLAFPTRR